MSSTVAATMSAGDPLQQQVFQDPNPLWLGDFKGRLDKLEEVYAQLKKEEQIREKNSFVRELHDQYKVALALLEDPDE